MSGVFVQFSKVLPALPTLLSCDRSSDISHCEVLKLSTKEVPEDEHSSWIFLFFFSSCFFSFSQFSPGIMYSIASFQVVPPNSFQGFTVSFWLELKHEVSICSCVWLDQTHPGGWSDNTHIISQMAHFFLFSDLYSYFLSVHSGGREKWWR